MSNKSQGEPDNGEAANPQKDKPDPSGLPCAPMEGGEVLRGPEFGGLDGATLPGQDPMRVHELIRLLTKDLHPCNLIERYWIQEIAMLTARAEYLRKVHWAAVLRIMERLALQEVGRVRAASGDNQALVAEAMAALELVRRVRAGRDELAASLDPRWQVLLGEAFTSELALIDKLMQLEFLVLRERDRVLEMRDKRHAMQVREALLMISNGLLSEARNLLDDPDEAE